MVERHILDILRHKDEVEILDAGGRSDYWRMLSDDLRPKVRIICMNFQDELDRYKSGAADLRIEEVEGDACAMPQYADGSFDLVHSNSVIEHVGSLRNMARFAAETRRVGNAYHIQTPNFWFPIEPHYAFPLVHWLPDQVRLWLFTHFDVGYARKCSFPEALGRVDHTRMIGASMLRQLYPDGRLEKERMGFMAKSLTVVRDFDPSRRN
ncbi:class I SAM-dependent methyltransferase [Roseitranquillus sediminis]|uniref:class I SAM-dependent methyltransferase n=1 Tax=Roseitranquillus sediminis TaxID=2809051 RepID=UPI001D0C9D67|nr:class I SAM-dependent methyltransferase [Roseitranquillus sediminis]MBM9595175.1 class I SAM-dependent methyltransferase [Roseitranquillus sediminis]